MENPPKDNAGNPTRDDLSVLFCKVLASEAPADEKRHAEEIMRKDPSARQMYEELRSAYSASADVGAVLGASSKETAAKPFPEYRLRQLMDSVHRKAKNEGHEQSKSHALAWLWRILSSHRAWAGAAAAFVVLLVVAIPMLRPQSLEAAVFSELGSVRGEGELKWLSDAGPVRPVHFNKTSALKDWCERRSHERNKSFLWVNLDDNTAHVVLFTKDRRQESRSERLADNDAERQKQVARLLREIAESK